MKKQLADLPLETVLLVARNAGQKAASDTVHAGRVVTGWTDGKLVEYGPGTLPLSQTPCDVDTAKGEAVFDHGLGLEDAQASPLQAAQRRIAAAIKRMQSAPPCFFNQEEWDALASYEGHIVSGDPKVVGTQTSGDKMTPPVYTRSIEEASSKESAMLAHTGKRLTTRITDHVQEKLQVAADLVGATLNQFVVQAALEKADKVIESESTIALTRRESLRLLEIMENPPSRNEKFLQAQARYQRIKNDDGSTAK